MKSPEAEILYLLNRARLSGLAIKLVAGCCDGSQWIRSPGKVLPSFSAFIRASWMKIVLLSSVSRARFPGEMDGKDGAQIAKGTGRIGEENKR